MTDLCFDALAEPFDRDAVSWRCQTLSKDGSKGLALAYIDARDVMRRLDSVVGPANWQDRYEVHGSKTLCYLSILYGEAWITKADGAGDTDVEAEKGSLSDAFKRAAVKWGIGRYLYDVPAPWVPCKTYEAGGKKRWSEWTADPWSCVRQPPRPAATASDPRVAAKSDPNDDAWQYVSIAKTAMLNASSIEELNEWWRSEAGRRHSYGLVKGTPEYDHLVEAVAKVKQGLTYADKTAAG